MFNNLIFVGGVHGVGKGTFCDEIKSQFDLVHLSASDVLKWAEIKGDSTDKKVKDIAVTQDRLVAGLERWHCYASSF